MLRPPRDLGLDPAIVLGAGADRVRDRAAGGPRTRSSTRRPTRRSTGPPDERPPLLVLSHGGPTARPRPQLQPRRAVTGPAAASPSSTSTTAAAPATAAPTASGSNGSWGIVDVDDCVAAAAHLLAERGVVDGERLAIRGGSAGGYTTLAALAFRDVFAAGASHYGVADLEALAQDTHKFESRYLDGLVGPYPEARERLRASARRSTTPTGFACP